MTITLTQSDIIQACKEFLQKSGYVTTGNPTLRVQYPENSKPDKDGVLRDPGFTNVIRMEVPVSTSIRAKKDAGWENYY